ncbi:MAG: glycoside hydrolase family 3 protein, partial [Selenomonadaceae bacterium]|nr:glycoside hydrolase family 3 protein [Selenomonadaceae bacterium]
MKHLSIIVTMCLFCLFSVTGCGAEKADKAVNPAKENVAEKAKTVDDKAEEIMASMTLAEKVGQMVMIGVHGEDVTDDSRFMLHQYHIGGIVLFDRNMKNAEQVKQLIDNLKKAGDKKAPMLFALDEEGGAVARMRNALTAPPEAASLGSAGDPSKAYAAMKETATEMKRIGFNVNFAPVADLALDRGRSYGNVGDKVSKFTSEACRGIADAGLIPTLKHFPGLGGATVDTHKGTAVVTKTRAELLANDLLPYKNAANFNYPYFIMIGHGTYSDIDTLPACISNKIVTGLLRKELAYDGVAVTDDLNMGAISMYDEKERAIRAIEAGCDMILSCHEYQIGTNMYLAILDAVEKGRIKEDRINQSVKRILKAKLMLK